MDAGDSAAGAFDTVLGWTDDGTGSAEPDVAFSIAEEGVGASGEALEARGDRIDAVSAAGTGEGEVRTGSLPSDTGADTLAERVAASPSALDVVAPASAAGDTFVGSSAVDRDGTHVWFAASVKKMGYQGDVPISRAGSTWLL